MIEKFHDSLNENNAEINISVKKYNHDRYNLPVKQITSFDLSDVIEIENSNWKVESTVKSDKQFEKCYELEAKFNCIAGQINEASVSVEFVFNKWTTKNYLLMPASVYNGNRYESRPQPYMPFFYNFDDLTKKAEILLSDVPRLNIGNGLSKIQERSGSMSTPAIGFYSQVEKKGFWLFTEQGTEFGDHGFTIEENRNRDKAFVSITNPVVRELYQYNMTNTHFNTTDVPVNFKEGDVIKIRLKVLFFGCNNIQIFFKRFNEIRNTMSLNSRPIDKLPYSEAFKIIHQKFNEQNYNDREGYYRVGMGENAFQDWQIGWTGGMISTYPLLFHGDSKTKQRVIQNFNWLFSKGISPGGLFWGIGEEGGHFFGEFEKSKPLGKDLVLVRKQGDAIYYILKQMMLMAKMDIAIEENWKLKLKSVIDTLIEIWKKDQQLGHYIDIKTNEIIVGGSTSGGIVPAALCLAGRYYQSNKYIETAEEIGVHYYDHYISKGLTYGGVGDAMHNFDSESAYGLLESMALLYETTQNRQWLDRAESMAHQFATWVINYDYTFPKDSLFGKLDMQTKGTVFANTQNKHLAPGICTHSGIALLRIFRATKNKFYINLLRDIVRTIPQYLAHPNRPIPGMKEGWMSERVNSTDWWEPIGEIFCGSTWSETSCMLSYAEIPGIYIIPELQLIVCPDNVNAKILNFSNSKIVIEVENKTAFDAEILVFAEQEKELTVPWGENRLFDANTIVVSKNSCLKYTLDI